LLWVVKLRGSLKLIRLLIDSGADINIKYNKGQTILYYAVKIEDK
jgi:hypothetical protein